MPVIVIPPLVRVTPDSLLVNALRVHKRGLPRRKRRNRKIAKMAPARANSKVCVAFPCGAVLGGFGLFGVGLSVEVAVFVALTGSVVPLKSDNTHKGALINFFPESTCTTKTSFLEILQTGIKVASGLCAPLQSASPPAGQVRV